MVHTPTYASMVNPETSVSFIETHYRVTYLESSPTQAKVIFGEGTRAQLAHRHHISDLTRFGEGICHSCGMTMWSPAWVALDVFGDGTGEYLSERIRAWTERVNSDHMRLSLPGILASMTDDDPATLTVLPTIGQPVKQPEPI